MFDLKSFGLGVVLSIFVVVELYGAVSLLTWLYNWQTLVAGFVASTAAAISIRAIYDQINQLDQIEKNRAKRRNFAARPAMAQPLSNIIRVQNSIIGQFTSFLEQYPERQYFEETYEVPSVSEADKKYLIDCIVEADDFTAADISEILSDLQIQNARLAQMGVEQRNDRRLGPDRKDIRYYAADAVFIYARASRLLHYARRQDSEYKASNLFDVVQSTCSIATRALEVGEILERRCLRSHDKWLLPREN